MVKKIAITGGKGGTGKTLISTNLAVQLHTEGYNVLLIDCDTENPNSNILLGKNLDDDDVKSEDVNIFMPIFEEDKCTKCGKCRESCYRHAILQFPGQYPSLMEHMCSGCETCQKICPEKAISTGYRPIGKQYYIKNLYQTDNVLDLLVGELKEGEAVSVLIVEELIKHAEKLNDLGDGKERYDYFIIDTSPGAHCDVEHSLESAEMIIGVTEPTPFGVHDLKRIMELIEIVNKKASVIINRSDLTDYKEEVMKLSKEKGGTILGEIPLSNIIIEDYARGKPFVSDERDFPAKTAFLEIFNKIKEGVVSSND